MIDADYQRLVAQLALDVETHEHPPVLTVDDAVAHWASIDAAHTKNLLLKDEGRRFWLVVLPTEARADLKALPAMIGSRRLRFASSDDLERLLGVTTGAVSPLALVSDRERQVTLAVQEDLMSASRLAFHPLRNDATVTMTPAELVRYLAATGHSPIAFTLG